MSGAQREHDSEKEAAYPPPSRKARLSLETLLQIVSLGFWSADFRRATTAELMNRGNHQYLWAPKQYREANALFRTAIMLVAHFSPCILKNSRYAYKGILNIRICNRCQ